MRRTEAADWTRGADGRSNTSDAYRTLVDEVDALIRSEAHALIHGQSHTVAALIVAQLAHKHGVEPLPVQPDPPAEPSVRERALVHTAFYAGCSAEMVLAETPVRLAAMQAAHDEVDATHPRAPDAERGELESACAFLDAHVDDGGARPSIKAGCDHGGVNWRADGVTIASPWLRATLAACIIATAKALGWQPAISSSHTDSAPLSRAAAMRVAEAVMRDLIGIDTASRMGISAEMSVHLAAIVSRVVGEPSERERAERAALEALLTWNTGYDTRLLEAMDALRAARAADRGGK